MTKQETVKALAELILVLRDIIRAAGKEGIPSGHLYAHCMGGMTLETYEKLIKIFLDSGKVERKNHVLYWIGD
jgi:hypothetical protein